MLRRNVLIFHQAALGDFIVTWPLAMALSRVFPQSRIIYVTHSQKGALAEKVLRVESADAEGGWHSLFSDSLNLPERAAKMLAGAHLVVSFGPSGNDMLARGVAKVAPDANILSLDTNQPGLGHITDILMMQLQSQSSALASAMQQMLRSVAERGVGLVRSAGVAVVIHPGAGKEKNRWPAERYLDLARRLARDGKNVRVLLGEAELEKWPAELIGQLKSDTQVARPASLVELLDQLSRAQVFVGNDSGPAHLAGIIGVATVALFGVDPTRWRPLGPNVRVVQSDALQELPEEDVYTHVSQALGG